MALDRRPRARADQHRRTDRPSRARPARPVRGGATIYGLHAARAAIANPCRVIHNVLATANAADRLAESLAARGLSAQITPAETLAARAGSGAVHQGVVVEAEPLPVFDVDDLSDLHLLIVVDQITDPQNVGAILRSAAAFGAGGLVMTARHSPPLDGALAKAASGGLEHVPVALVPNLARALEALGERDVMRIGLDSGGDAVFEDQPAFAQLALVLGAEDKGLRRLTREHCDAVCALAAPGAITSLNVSNAAAIALHHAWLARRGTPG